MKYIKIILTIMFLFLVVNCDTFEDFESNGIVNFKIEELNFTSESSPNSKLDNSNTNNIIESSVWKHIFKDNAVLVIKNKNSTAQHTINFNPNNDTDLTITIPYGDYTFESVVTGGVIENHLPFKINGEFTLKTSTMDITMNITTDYGLVTLNHGFVSSVKVLIGTQSNNMTYIEERAHYYAYVKNNTNIELNITENVRGTVIKRTLLVLGKKHYNYILRIQTGDLSFVDLLLEPFEYIEYVVPIGALEYKVGDTLELNATPNFGWRFEHWTVNDVILPGVNEDLLFVMPDYDVNIVAHFVKQ
jgi:hypothetical protein